MAAELAGYLGLVVLITLTPGIDTAVVTRSVVSRGQRAGMLTGLGCGLGLFVHAIAVAVGAAALLRVSALAFEALKLVGAAYLVLLGALALRDSWRRSRDGAARPDLPGPGGQGVVSKRSPLLVGLLTNLTNPKAALFFLSALPQFLPANPVAALPVAAALAVVPVLASSLFFAAFSFGLGRIRHLLNSGRVKRIQQRVLGATLVSLGVKTALE